MRRKLEFAILYIILLFVCTFDLLLYCSILLFFQKLQKLNFLTCLSSRLILTLAAIVHIIIF